MALRALQGRVEAGQREPGRGVIEDRAQPVRSAMALLASRREARLLVIRIRGAVVIGLVALDASPIGIVYAPPGNKAVVWHCAHCRVVWKPVSVKPVVE